MAPTAETPNPAIPGDLIVAKQHLDRVQLVEPLDPATPLEPGQILVEIERFGITANNISYAVAGDMLGYWAFFPADDPDWGRVPAWGFADVVRSEHPDISVGERIFGFVPMGRRLLMAPTAVGDLCFSDGRSHRVDLHPWYNRYYRTAADPVSTAGGGDLQPVLWALFMTGWELANDFVDNADHGAGTVIVASASSKTAFSFARSLHAARTGIAIVGLTSAANEDLVRGLGCYDTVMTYDRLDLDALEGDVAFVDMAGNGELAATIHGWFGDRLTKSYRVGATHRTARGGGPLTGGAEPQFFFIPDVAEAKAAALGHAAYHAEFARAWADMAPWVASWIDIRIDTGPEALRRGYLDALTNGTRPTEARLVSYTAGAAE